MHTCKHSSEYPNVSIGTHSNTPDSEAALTRDSEVIALEATVVSDSRAQVGERTEHAVMKFSRRHFSDDTPLLSRA